MIQALMT